MGITVDSMCVKYKIGLTHTDGATTRDIYKHLLIDINRILLRLEMVPILYGSAALWLEGTPRIDGTAKLVMKDLDIAIRHDAPLNLMRLRGTIGEWSHKDVLLALHGIFCMHLNSYAEFFQLRDDKNAGGNVYVTPQGTMEFVSNDTEVQFSLNLKNDEDYYFLLNLSHPQRILNNHSDDEGNYVLMTGMKYTKARLLAPDGIIERTLFRDDKTIKIISNICVAVSCGHLYRSYVINKIEKTIKNPARLMREMGRLVGTMGALSDGARTSVAGPFHKGQVIPTPYDVARLRIETAGIKGYVAIHSLMTENFRKHDISTGLTLKYGQDTYANRRFLGDDPYIEEHTMTPKIIKKRIKHFTRKGPRKNIKGLMTAGMSMEPIINKSFNRLNLKTTPHHTRLRTYLEKTVNDARIEMLAYLIHTCDVVKINIENCKWVEVDNQRRASDLEAIYLISCDLEEVLHRYAQ